MGKILSVAIPAYNAERCLDRCLVSMLAESVLDQLDIVIVDDGSVDATGEIADSYAARFPGNVSVIHKENGGHGSGINTAVKQAVGKYFRVVDADDWLVTENLVRHIGELRQCRADLVINGFDRVKGKKHRKVPVCIPNALQGTVKTVEEISPFLPVVRNCFTIHGMTFCLEKYRSSHTQLSEGVFYEDNEFTILPFKEISTIYFSPLRLYQYFIGYQEQSVSDQNQINKLPHLGRVLLRLLDSYCEEDYFPIMAKEYVEEKIAILVVAYLTTCLLREPDRPAGRCRAEEMMKYIQSKCPIIYQKSVSRYRKLSVLHDCGINGKIFDAVLDSKVYQGLRDCVRNW